MAYTKHTWVDNEDITTARLNNIEEGVEEGIEAASTSSSFDAVISIYHDNDSGHDYVITVKSGTFAAIANKTINNQPPLVLAEIKDELTGYFGATTLTSIYYYPSETYPSNHFVFTVRLPHYWASNTDWFALTLIWDANNSVTAY